MLALASTLAGLHRAELTLEQAAQGSGVITRGVLSAL